MKIGIDISQLAYKNTGVANFTKNLIENLLEIDQKNQYILFFSSLRNQLDFTYVPFLNPRQTPYKNFTLKTFKLPPAALDLLWNKLHILPVENFTGDLDLFISSDWTQPPTKKAKKTTIVYDLIIYKYPEEMSQKIVTTQKRRLNWVKKECATILCISESTKRDAIKILGIEENKIKVIYPGV